MAQLDKCAAAYLEDLRRSEIRRKLFVQAGSCSAKLLDHASFVGKLFPA